MNVKYSVRTIDKNSVVSSTIFETYNLVEALQKVDEQEQQRNLTPETDEKYIIVSYIADPPTHLKSAE